jgi:arylsulfatase A-like enzyme
MKRSVVIAAAFCLFAFNAWAADKPNIVLILSDDFGYGNSGPYGGGPGRGMPKWHLGEADYALPNAQGYDEMRYVGLYHLNAYTYGDPAWFPDMDPKLREMRGDDGQPTGALAVDSNLGWKGAEKYVATVPQPRRSATTSS